MGRCPSPTLCSRAVHDPPAGTLTGHMARQAVWGRGQSAGSDPRWLFPLSLHKIKSPFRSH